MTTYKITGNTYAAKDHLKAAGALFVRDSGSSYWVADTKAMAEIKKRMNPSWGRKGARLLSALVIAELETSLQ